MFTFIHKTKLLGEVDTFGAPFMRKLFSRAEGVLLVQVEVSKGVVDHPVMSLVRPDQKHRNIETTINMKRGHGKVKNCLMANMTSLIRALSESFQ